jgi:hypothetical protein
MPVVQKTADMEEYGKVGRTPDARNSQVEQSKRGEHLPYAEMDTVTRDKPETIRRRL